MRRPISHRHRRSSLLSVVAGLLALSALSCTEPPTGARVVDGESRAQSLVSADGSIPGHYIVVANWDVNASSLAAEYGVAPRHVYEQLLNGFAASLSDEVAARLAADPRVVRISVQRQLAALETVTQPGATWGLDRIDQRALPLDSLYAYDRTGRGVTAYIIDTGIRYSHREFGGRARPGFDAYANDPTDPLLGYDYSGDCHGHGTHVAGTVGGATWGVAKQVALVGIRVLNCAGYGSDADVIAGMDWVAKMATLPATANMSLGDVIPTKTMGTSTEVDNAVRALVASGVVLGVAAGNGWGNGTVGADACMFPISNVPEAITVAASTRTDARTQWTNYGECIDLFAPGSGIMSATFDSDSSAGSKSGTSMATPHVVGVAALLLDQAPGATPAEVRDVMVQQATQAVIAPTSTNNGVTSNNHLLFSRAIMPGSLRGKQPKHLKPCTPRRQRDGVC